MGEQGVFFCFVLFFLLRKTIKQKAGGVIPPQACRQQGRANVIIPAQRHQFVLFNNFIPKKYPLISLHVDLMEGL